MPKKITLSDDGDKIRQGMAEFPWVRSSLLLLVGFGIVFPFTRTGKDIVATMKKEQFAEGKTQGTNLTTDKFNQEIARLKAEVTAAKAKPAPKPPVVPVTPAKKRMLVTEVHKDSDIRKTTRGFNLKYEADFQPGDFASAERERDNSYVADFKLKVKLPKPATTVEELELVNPKLGEILPGLETLVENAKVSPFYSELYEKKSAYLKKRVMTLGETLTMHNFYDCQTMLEITHPSTKRKVFLFQADMDVVTDGSDGDRLETMEDKVVNSTYYQPFTSYGWPKTTNKPNPMIAGWKKRIVNGTKEYNSSSTSSERKKWLKSRLKYLKEGIADMEKRSFLIADHDPFIVISYDQFKKVTPSNHVPHVGDYVAVIYKDKIYPAIVGDGGPSFKTGEGSLRLAKEINPAASSYHRPVSTLGVTYIVFPRSAPKPRIAPNYERWYSECSDLLNDIGGLGDGYQLHQWEDTLKKLEDERLAKIAAEEAEDARLRALEESNAEETEDAQSNQE